MHSIRRFINLIETYQEEDGGNFESNDISYDINRLFADTEGDSVQQFRLDDLDWLLDEEPIEDEDRVSAANLDIPILVTREQGLLVVVDGFHRLAKASRAGHNTIPGIMVSHDLMIAARLCWDRRTIDRLLVRIAALRARPFGHK